MLREEEEKQDTVRSSSCFLYRNSVRGTPNSLYLRLQSIGRAGSLDTFDRKKQGNLNGSLQLSFKRSHLNHPLVLGEALS